MKAVNLLPESHRTRAGSGARAGSAYWTVGALAVLVLGALLYVTAANQVTSREQDIAETQRELAEAQARSSELSSFGNFTQTKAIRAASVTQLAQSRFDWERFVRELAHVLPNGVWLTEVNASASGEDESGAAPEAGSATGDATVAGLPSAEVIGCSPDQRDVATLMVRLRKLYRAQDVTLRDSSSPTASGGGSNDECGPAYSFDMTVAFTAIPPAVGDGRVPVSLGGGQ